MQALWKRLHVNKVIDIKYDTIDYIVNINTINNYTIVTCKWLSVSKIAVTKPTSNKTRIKQQCNKR